MGTQTKQHGAQSWVMGEQLGGQAGFWEKGHLLESLPDEPVEAEQSRGQGRLPQRCGGNRLPLSRRQRDATEAVATREKEIRFLLWKEIDLSEPSRLLSACRSWWTFMRVIKLLHAHDIFNRPHVVMHLNISHVSCWASASSVLNWKKEIVPALKLLEAWDDNKFNMTESFIFKSNNWFCY